MMRSLGVCLLGSSFGQDLFLEKKDADVIIIGAGWAGMTAARELHKAGVNFLVLEAAPVTGGRSSAMPFGNESVKRFVLERGSGWVCGVGGGQAGHNKEMPSKPTENPIHKLAIEAGLKMTLIPGGTMNMSNYAGIYDSDGNRVDLDGKLRQRANKAYDCINVTSAASNSKEKSFRQALTDCGWVPKSEVEWAVDWGLTVDDPGFPALHDTVPVPDPTYQWWGKDDYFVIDQDPRGYAKVVDYMVKDTVPSGDSRVLLNSWVSKIAYDSKGVTVSTKDGRNFTAKEVIPTVSIGVLHHKHKELFDPALPDKVQAALSDEHIFMANLTRVIFQFPTVWWDDSLPRWLSAIKGATTSAASGEFAEWQNLNHVSLHPGSQTLLGFVGDPQSTKYEAMTDAAVKATALAALRAQHPQKSIPDPVAFYLSRWGRTSVTYGTYSGFSPGMKYNNFHKAMNKPVKVGKYSRIRFAGEAVCSNLPGWTHGGYQSGLEVAAQYLHAVGKGPDPSNDDSLNLCWW